MTRDELITVVKEKLEQFDKQLSGAEVRAALLVDHLAELGELHVDLVHRYPLEGKEHMPCCGRTPFEVSDRDGVTSDPNRVTCRP